MKDARIKEILEAYRPGQDLETDPEVRAALDATSGNAGLQAWRASVQAFDAAFGAQLRGVPVPEGLQARILEARSRQGKSPSAGQTGKLLKWIHPAALAAAAAIIILLALSFTFWRQPGGSAAPVAAQPEIPGLAETTRTLYASLSPSFKSQRGEEIQRYIQQHGGMVPENPPSGFTWDRSFACDIVDVNGKKVSIICFKPQGREEVVHLFTFHREDFPNEQIPASPWLRPLDGAHSATWGDEKAIHVLVSGSGEENLRAVLDI